METIAHNDPKHYQESDEKKYSAELLRIDRGIFVRHIAPGVKRGYEQEEYSEKKSHGSGHPADRVLNLTKKVLLCQDHFI